MRPKGRIPRNYLCMKMQVDVQCVWCTCKLVCMVYMVYSLWCTCKLVRGVHGVWCMVYMVYMQVGVHGVHGVHAS